MFILNWAQCVFENLHFVFRPIMSQSENPPEYSKTDSPPYPSGSCENQVQLSSGGPYPTCVYQPSGSQNPPKTGLVLTAPSAAYRVMQAIPPANTQACAAINDYQAMNLFLMLCCCLPLGAIAVMKSNGCKEAKRYGDVARATQLSSEAKKWGFITLGFGLPSLVIGVGIVIFNYLYLSGLRYNWCAANVFSHITNFYKIVIWQFGEKLCIICKTNQ